jgi:hypothetical protein
MTSGPSTAQQQDMLVIQFGDRTVKGYTDAHEWPTAQEVDLRSSRPMFRRIGGEASEEIPLEGVKAVFFVKSFEGKWHDDLRFHDHLPAPDCLWVRVTFEDGEIIEGLIANDQNFVIHSGFYMAPIDPEGNNWLIYVLKNKLKELQILGLRPAPKNVPVLIFGRAATTEEHHRLNGSPARVD